MFVTTRVEHRRALVAVHAAVQRQSLGHPLLSLAPAPTVIVCARLDPLASRRPLDERLAVTRILAGLIQSRGQIAASLQRSRKTRFTRPRINQADCRAQSAENLVSKFRCRDKLRKFSKLLVEPDGIEPSTSTMPL